MKEGWKRVTLGEVVLSIEDGDWIESKDQSPNGIRLIQTGNIGIGVFRNKSENARFISVDTFKRLHCNEIFAGDILVSRLPDPVGRACILPKLDCRAITAVDCSIIRLKKETIDSKYFIYYSLTNNYFNMIKSQCTGSTRLRITRKKLFDINIPLPPLTEQQRIVEFLDSTFAEIDALKAKAAEEVANAKAMFDAALREEMTPKEGWEEKTLGEICDVRDGTHDSPKYVDEGYPLVTSKNLKGSHIDMSNVKYISEKDYYQINDRSKVNIGDILFAMIGTIGNATLVVDEPNYAIKNMALFKTKTIEQGRFLKYLLDSSIVLDEMHEKSKGTTQQFVSLGYLRSFKVHIPQDAQQHSIVTRLDSLRSLLTKLEQKYAKIAAECDALKQAILKETFE